MTTPSRTVVVATKDRPELLNRLLEVVREQIAADGTRVVVVDDGSEPPVRVERASGVLVHRTRGVGPAGARNCGWRLAESDWIVFVDDDVVPQPGWWGAVGAAITEAEAEGAVAVEGRVITETVDPLYERSVARDSGGWGLTCNVAYRRGALEAVEGFDEQFPAPHCEDLDLFFRVGQQGAARFAEAMVVRHAKRPFGFPAAWRRGTWGGSEMRLARKHPGIFHTPSWVPVRGLPVFLTLVEWVGNYRLEPRPRRPRRLLRLVALASLQTASSARTALSSSTARELPRSG